MPSDFLPCSLPMSRVAAPCFTIFAQRLFHYFCTRVYTPIPIHTHPKTHPSIHTHPKTPHPKRHPSLFPSQYIPIPIHIPFHIHPNTHPSQYIPIPILTHRYCEKIVTTWHDLYTLHSG